ncbi:MAG: hypothetical protein ACP5QO_03970 [Clostridia bacterium]
MKYLEEIYGLFVEDPLLALMGLLALGAGALVAHLGLHLLGGLIEVIVIIVGLVWSVRKAAH